jgi:outer membrane protein TolC
LNGLELKQNEGRLIFSPILYAQGQMLIDKKPTTSVNAQGDQTDNTLGTVGLLKQFDFGLKGKLGYTLAHTQIYNASPTFLPTSKFNDSQLAIELTQSLWRNWGGTEANSQEKIVTSDQSAKMHIEQFKIRTILSSAESVYWTVSQLGKMLLVQKASLERARKIKNWAENRNANGLGDKSDLLQSDANVKFREYELLATEQQLKNTSRTFNSFRGIDQSELSDLLDSITNDHLKKLSLPKKAPLREDTKAALAYEKLAKANADLAVEKNKPTLELYGNYALNGRDTDRQKAISKGFENTHSTTAVGIRFQVPLDFTNLVENIRGYKKDQTAAELTVKQKIFDQDRDWNDLLAKFDDAKTNLNLVEKIAEAQKLKSANERDRLSKGRTTTFQVLNFEQDYAQSELLRIKSELEIINIYAQSNNFLSGGN